MPLGVIGIIYESRPNVTTDAASLFQIRKCCYSSRRKRSVSPNQILVTILQEALIQQAVSPHLIQFVDDTSRETAQQLMRLNDYLDVLIPRGGANLIKLF